MPLRRHLRGFTIVELMTVLVVAGVLLTIAVPSFTDLMAKRRFEGQTNEFVTDLHYAKSEAVQRNRSIELRTGGGGTCYTVAVMTAATPPVGNCDCAAAPGARCPVADTTELKTVTLTTSASVTDARVFVFEPVRGALEPAVAASAVVALGARSHTVEVTAYGRVTPLAP